MMDIIITVDLRFEADRSSQIERYLFTMNVNDFPSWNW